MMIAEREVGDVSAEAMPAQQGDVDWHEKTEPVQHDTNDDTREKKDIAVTEDQFEQDELEVETAKPRVVEFLRHYWILHLCVAVSLAILVNLSLWQLTRLDQKLALIERAEVRAVEPPVAAPGPDTWANLTSDEIDYMPVEVSGQFILGELFYFDTLTKPKGQLGGQGYFIYSPFITEEGWTVLVNLGFVPLDRKEFSTRLGSAPPRGTVTITGLARRAEIPSTFSVAPNQDKDEWYVREPKVMAESMGLLPDQTAPYSIDLQETLNLAGELPQAGETRMTFSNNHLQYAFTWAGLAFTLIGVYLAFLIKAWLDQKKGSSSNTEDDFDDEDEPEEDRYDRLSKAAKRERK
ncbi:SURF1 family protein [Pseudovibrio axinellae]|uniref:SURF1-like protein n=1 Tax=Pseudovibrio axinellae TaxID=989403 RepID=A0A165YE42_9HYPH|nr:SURF1 family protein [Pseudovibrio axinellae]KZL18761.1 SURF1 family protein [Pseudovibrio axinellae]SEP93786.1 surfeit locus 1 family protein [Pseudovibrio axinellae]